MDSELYKRGQLIRLKIKNRYFTDDGFVTVGTYGITSHDDTATIFEEVKLSSYPSCNDFFGSSTVVRHGDLATVLSFKGRPQQVKPGIYWSHYDVYEILINGVIRQVFRFNIEPLFLLTD